MTTKEKILNSLVRIEVTFYCMGLLTFLVFANFAPEGMYNKWNWLYYWWEKIFGAGFVIWLAIYIKCSSRNRVIVAPVLLYSLIRVFWDVISFFVGAHINSPIIIAILFIILLGICYWFTLREGNFADKWLSKILFN